MALRTLDGSRALSNTRLKLTAPSSTHPVDLLTDGVVELRL